MTDERKPSDEELPPVPEPEEPDPLEEDPNVNPEPQPNVGTQDDEAEE